MQEMNITTKFTIATDQGLETLLMLIRELAVEQYASVVDSALLERYIAENFKKRHLPTN